MGIFIRHDFNARQAQRLAIKRSNYNSIVDALKNGAVEIAYKNRKLTWDKLAREWAVWERRKYQRQPDLLLLTYSERTAISKLLE